VAYDRSGHWAERRLESVDAVLELPAIGARLPLSQIYWQTGLIEG
jgi:hypothetical protein